MLRAALLELGETGWGSLSVEQIVDRSGVHKTTIYRRWGSANQVALEALLDRGSEGIPVPDTGDVTADLIALGRSISLTISEPIGRSIAAAAIEAPDSSSIWEVADAFWSERFDQAGLVVMRAIERGQLPDGVDPRSVIEGVAAPIWFRVMVSRLPVTDSWLAEVVGAEVSTARNRIRSGERNLRDS
ncbi:MAG TPA: TetR/AcrR family transcriptional regulator [Acidimicrobiia bacterium]|nr:TetR/AcrR family transcriptional regulator [Acidimicrobiia bacterium]